MLTVDDTNVYLETIVPFDESHYSSFSTIHANVSEVIGGNGKTVRATGQRQRAEGPYFSLFQPLFRHFFAARHIFVDEGLLPFAVEGDEGATAPGAIDPRVLGYFRKPTCQITEIEEPVSHDILIHSFRDCITNRLWRLTEK